MTDNVYELKHRSLDVRMHDFWHKSAPVVQALMDQLIQIHERRGQLQPSIFFAAGLKAFSFLDDVHLFKDVAFKELAKNTDCPIPELEDPDDEDTLLTRAQQLDAFLGMHPSIQLNDEHAPLILDLVEWSTAAMPKTGIAS